MPFPSHIDTSRYYMASSAIKSEEDKQELFDSPEELDAKVTRLAEMVEESTHFVVFTGAGVSTSTGIPDFRSGYNTVLPTGPGMWEELAERKPVQREVVKAIPQALPSPTHMSLVALMEAHKLKYLISQNVDGLHRKSGIPASKIAELHGNTYLETCKVCRKDYLRDYETRTNADVHRHETGRRCDNGDCGGELCDSIINFGENLREEVVRGAFGEAESADLCLVLGSSLRVTPAAHVPRDVKRHGGKLVLVNLQRTPYDEAADLVIHSFCDQVILLLMSKLHLKTPKFTLKRRLKISREPYQEKECIRFQGVDMDGSPYSIFPKIEAHIAEKVLTITREPMRLIGTCFDGLEGQIFLYFHGHYHEPALDFPIVCDEIPMDSSKTYEMTYDPWEQVWTGLFEIREVLVRVK